MTDTDEKSGQRIEEPRGIAAWRVVSILLGALLLLAAGLKLYGWSVSSVPRVAWFSSPDIQAIFIGWEIFLGIYLFTGIFPIGSWLAAIGTFTLLAGISGYLGWIGQANCGCFGAIKFSPWWAFGIDVSVVALLVLIQPQRRVLGQTTHAEWRHRLKMTLFGAIGVLTLLGMISLVAYLSFGSLPAALAALRGERLSISPRLVNVGNGLPGEIKEVQIELVNRADKLICVVGGTSDCSCTTTLDLPLDIRPGETKAIAVKVVLPHSVGVFNHTAMLIMDDGGLRQISFQLTAKINEGQGVRTSGSQGARSTE